ncbi:hypothetical protein V8F20_000509 [Naviculisporaceae sp. PSN 640]
MTKGDIYHDNTISVSGGFLFLHRRLFGHVLSQHTFSSQPSMTLWRITREHKRLFLAQLYGVLGFGVIRGGMTRCFFFLPLLWVPFFFWCRYVRTVQQVTKGYSLRIVYPPSFSFFSSISFLHL